MRSSQMHTQTFSQLLIRCTDISQFAGIDVEAEQTTSLRVTVQIHSCRENELLFSFVAHDLVQTCRQCTLVIRSGAFATDKLPVSSSKRAARSVYTICHFV